ncbi:hypothetical protein PHSY_003426 [Pseudozyma hubeiensis SY62]|uniref:Uncharacterized protein n=1 Tax=Pseudozyma hubeiensis (strain SY62) TaxID=1305764 RepID=R9P3J4_PSEHS|nr:hypothetical protein PHSY_003426 [Pseudozyma hubeiensis SY62]GAC95849.1 hypothetical protein PHSY_003426 [Pseudozyma hubeiensis SY62]
MLSRTLPRVVATPYRLLDDDDLDERTFRQRVFKVQLTHPRMLICGCRSTRERESSLFQLRYATISIKEGRMIACGPVASRFDVFDNGRRRGSAFRRHSFGPSDQSHCICCVSVDVGLFRLRIDRGCSAPKTKSDEHDDSEE